VTEAILLVGVALAIATAVAMVRPGWRIPALAFGLFAIPGNVDDLMPQMTLDPHAIAFNTAPAVSFVDVLILLAVVLTMRDRPDVRGWSRIMAIAVVVAVAATATSIVAAWNGVDPLAAVRGIAVFARISALLFIAAGTAGSWRVDDLCRAVGVGVVALLANGVYTTASSDLPRFTAATFGRNSLAFALVAAAVVVAGFCFERGWRSGRARADAPAAALVAGAALLGALATGTRMALVLFGLAIVVAILHARGRSLRAVTKPVAFTALAVMLVAAAAVVGTAGGSRTLSFLTGAGTGSGSLLDPNVIPGDPEVQSRTEFWSLAVRMTADSPLAGVGPFQWNVERYAISPETPVVVADPHNAYLQIGAEFGLIVLVAYVALLVTLQLTIHWRLWRWTRHGPAPWTVIGMAAATAIYPFAEVTNSHLFNVRMGAFCWLVMASAFVLVGRLDDHREGSALDDRTP